MNEDNRLPEHIERFKSSYSETLLAEYPIEDIEQTDMFAPFFKRKRTWLVIFGIILFLLSLFFIPVDLKQHANANLDQEKVRIGLGIFVFVAFLWLTEALPLSATALMVPILATLFGVMDLKSALASFASPTIFIFFGGFALAAALAYQGVDRWIANRMVIIGRGSILRIAALLFGATAFLSMWMSNTATTAMMIPLVLGILSQTSSNQDSKSNNTAIFMLLGVAYSASVGGIGTIIGSPPNAIAADQLGINFQQWMYFGIPTVIVLLPLMFIVLVLAVRPQTKSNVVVERSTFRFNWHRITVLIIFICTALAWVFSRKLKAMIGVQGSMDALIALIAVIVLLYFRVVRWRDIDHATDWGVLILFGGGIALSSVLKTTGASLFLARIFADTVANLPIFVIVTAIIAFIIFLTELSSNTATAALFVPIFIAVATELGKEPEQLVIPLAIAASCAFMLPVATPPNAIVFGTGKIPQKSMMRIGIILNIVFIIAVSLLANFFF